MGEKNVVKLEDVCEFFRGLTYSKKNETTFSDKIVLRASNIDLDTSTLVLHDLKYLKENFVIPDDKKLQKDCIFICMSSGSKSHLGKVAYIARDYDYAFGGFMGLIKPKTNILPRYLFYLLQTPEYKELIKKLSNGININNIKFSDLKEFQFELPSLEEQEKILNILDKADEIRTKKKQANEKLDEFLKSTFVNMFGDPVKNEKGWKTESLSSVAPIRSYNGSVKENDGKYWLLNLDVVESNTGKILEYNYEESIPNSTCCFNSNMVLYSKLRPYLNKVVLPNKTGYATSELVPLNPIKEKLNKYFLASLLRSRCFVNDINIRVAGAKMPRVSMDYLRNFSVILPPIEEQNKFARIVEKVEEQKQRNEKVIEQMDNLFNSLSQKAFKGELQ